MTTELIDSYNFLTDYVHLTFLVGIIISYLYFRERQISIGGSLAVGYLASSLYMPMNVLVTILVSLLSFVLIRFVILKVFLPRPRQIFAIGLAMGVVYGGLVLVAGHGNGVRPGVGRRDRARHDLQLPDQAGRGADPGPAGVDGAADRRHRPGIDDGHLQLPAAVHGRRVHGFGRTRCRCCS